MDRVTFLVMMAIALLWQSNCLEFTDGRLINRCGLWQRFSGQPMTISMGSPTSSPVVIERIIEKVITVEKPTVIEKTVTVEKPTIVYRDRPNQVIMVDPRVMPRGSISSFATSSFMIYQ